MFFLVSKPLIITLVPSKLWTGPEIELELLGKLKDLEHEAVKFGTSMTRGATLGIMAT